MGLGLIIIGLGLGAVAASMTFASGAGLLWALAAYMTVGTLGIFAAAGLVLSRGTLSDPAEPAAVRAGPLPAASPPSDA